MSQPNLPQFFKTLSLLFLILFGGQAMFGGLVWWLMQRQPGFTTSGVLGGNAILALAILAWMTFASFFLYRRRTMRGATLKSLPAKLVHYRISCLFRWIMLEFGNMLVIALAFLDRNDSILIYFTLGLLIFLLTKPSQQRFEYEYQVLHST